MACRFKLQYLFVFFLSTQNNVFGSTPKLFERFQSSLEQSVKFVRLSDGKVLYELDAQKKLIPASVTKLLSSAALLDSFKPHHRFKTDLFYTGLKKDGEVKGDLIIKGDGDPLILSESLWNLSKDLRLLGYQKFTGHLVIDNSIFDNEFRNSIRKRSAKQGQKSYDAPISAFGVNFNTHAVFIGPGDQINQNALVAIDPYQTSNIFLDAKVKAGKSSLLRVSRVADSKKKSSLVVRGQVASNAENKHIYRSVADPVLSSGAYAKRFLQEQGIEIVGSVVAGKTPKNATYFYTHKSKQLSEIIKSLNWYSNNYVADVLTKRLGYEHELAARKKTALGSYASGVHAIQAFLKNRVKIKSDFFLSDGSGLSPKNRLSADQLVSVLEYMAKHVDLFPEYLASLPSSGRTGSLKERFSIGKTQSLEGFVRAKTGSLSSPVLVSSLAGFLMHPKEGLIAFAILQNGKNNKKANIVELRYQQELALLKIANYL